MSKRNSVPTNIKRITTYGELERYAEKFADRKLNFVIVLGLPGVGKSRIIRNALTATGADYNWIEGHSTGKGLYESLYDRRDQLTVFDDTDGILKDKDLVNLMKSACQSDETKRLQWLTSSGSEDVPHEFVTTSPVLLIANSLQSFNANVEAVIDRAIVTQFDPSPLEVRDYLAEWFWDQEVFDYGDDHLHLFSRLSLRWYVKAADLRAADLPWESEFLQGMANEKMRAVAELLADPSYCSAAERVAEFTAAGHGSRSTFFNYVRELRSTHQGSLERFVLPNAGVRPSDPNCLSHLENRDPRVLAVSPGGLIIPSEGPWNPQSPMNPFGIMQALEGGFPADILVRDSKELARIAIARSGFYGGTAS